MTAEEIKMTTTDDEHIGMLSKLMVHGWLSTKVEVQEAAAILVI